MGPGILQQIGSCTRGGRSPPSCCFKDLWLRFLCGSWKARVTRLEYIAEPVRISPADEKKANLVRASGQTLLEAGLVGQCTGSQEPES